MLIKFLNSHSRRAFPLSFHELWSTLHTQRLVYKPQRLSPQLTILLVFSNISFGPRHCVLRTPPIAISLTGSKGHSIVATLLWKRSWLFDTFYLHVHSPRDCSQRKRKFRYHLPPIHMCPWWIPCFLREQYFSVRNPFNTSTSAYFFSTALLSQP